MAGKRLREPTQPAAAPARKKPRTATSRSKAGLTSAPAPALQQAGPSANVPPQRTTRSLTRARVAQLVPALQDPEPRKRRRVAKRVEPAQRSPTQPASSLPSPVPTPGPVATHSPLPNELWLHIIRLLDMRELLIVARLCKLFSKECVYRIYRSITPREKLLPQQSQDLLVTLATHSVIASIVEVLDGQTAIVLQRDMQPLFFRVLSMMHGLKALVLPWGDDNDLEMTLTNLKMLKVVSRTVPVEFIKRHTELTVLEFAPGSTFDAYDLGDGVELDALIADYRVATHMLTCDDGRNLAPSGILQLCEPPEGGVPAALLFLNSLSTTKHPPGIVELDFLALINLAAAGNMAPRNNVEHVRLRLDVLPLELPQFSKAFILLTLAFVNLKILELRCLESFDPVNPPESKWMKSKFFKKFRQAFPNLCTIIGPKGETFDYDASTTKWLRRAEDTFPRRNPMDIVLGVPL